MAIIDPPHQQDTSLMVTFPRQPTFCEVVTVFLHRLRWLTHQAFFHGPTATYMPDLQRTLYLPRRIAEIYTDLLLPGVMPTSDQAAYGNIIQFIRAMQRGLVQQSLFDFGKSLCVLQKPLRELIFLANELSKAIERHGDDEAQLRDLYSSMRISLVSWHSLRVPQDAQAAMYQAFGNEYERRGTRELSEYLSIPLVLR